MRLCLLAALLFCVTLLPPRAVAQEDILNCVAAEQTTASKVDGKGHWDGVLPAGWIENFAGWSGATLTSAALELDGVRFLRFVSKSNQPAQFYCSMQGRQLKKGGNYRVVLRYRLQPGQDVSVGYRQGGAPYKSYWSAPLKGGSGWVTQSLIFSLKEDPAADSAFFLYINTEGTFDLSLLQLTGLTDAEMAALVRRPAKDTANFFRNSRFPLGLQSGWNISRDFQTGSCGRDDAHRSADGLPTLKMESADKTSLFSEPFQTADPAGENQVSFVCCGTGEWEVLLHGEGRDVLARKKFTPGENWSEVRLGYQANATAPGMCLEWVGKGRLNLDRLQAWTGAAERAYQSAGTCEIALAPVKSEIDFTRIQFVDEPARLQYRATGEFNGATLKTKIYNLYGEEKELPARMLSAETAAGTLDFAVFPGHELGQYRIEVWAEKGGKRASPFNEMVITRIRRPVAAGRDAPESPFGAHFNASPQTIPAIKAAGVNWARLHDAGLDHIGWAWLEAEKGKWSFHDAAIKRYRDAGISLYAELGTAPAWATNRSKIDMGYGSYMSYHDNFMLPLDLPDYANYVSRLAQHYKGVINEYFVWNEPWIGWIKTYDKTKKEYVNDLEHSPEEFTAMMKVAYAAAHAAAPEVKVAGFNTAGVSGLGDNFTRRVLQAGGLADCDTVEFHYYASRLLGWPGDDVSRAVNAAVGELRKQPGFNKPIYMSEGQSLAAGSSNTAVGDFGGLYKHTLPWSATDDYSMEASQTCRFVIRLLAEGVSRVFLYSTHCYEHLGAATWQVLLCTDGYPHPMLAAHSAMTGLLEGKKFVRTVELAPGVYAALFSGEAGSVAAVMGKAQATATLPQIPGASAYDLYGNPLQLPFVYNANIVYIARKGSAQELATGLGAK